MPWLAFALVPWLAFASAQWIARWCGQLRRKEERQAAQNAKLEGELAKQQAVIKRKNDELAAAHKKQKVQDHHVGGGSAPNTARRPGVVPGVAERAGPSGVAARKPAVAGQTLAFEHKQRCKKEDDLHKAVNIMCTKPREWLDCEVQAIVDHQCLRQQVHSSVGPHSHTRGDAARDLISRSRVVPLCDASCVGWADKCTFHG